MPEFTLLLQFCSVVFGVLAAHLWLESTKIKIPDVYSTHVVQPNSMPAGGNPPGGTYAGYGYTPQLTELGVALKEQSRLNAEAAKCTAFAVVFQIIQPAIALIIAVKPH